MMNSEQKIMEKCLKMALSIELIAIGKSLDALKKRLFRKNSQV
nr:MAG TPA: hypothetical protein [Caudoviricetes sp.]